MTMLRDPIAGAVIFAFSLAAYLIGGTYSGGAELFPRAICVIMMVCSAILFVRGLIRPTPFEALAEGDGPRIWVSMVLTVAYIVAIVPLGFLLASLIYVPIAAYALGLRKHIWIWITNFLVIGIVYYLFVRIFHAPLPQGYILPRIL